MADYRRYAWRRKSFKKSRHKKAMNRMNAFEFIKALGTRAIKRMYWDGRKWIIELVR